MTNEVKSVLVCVPSTVTQAPCPTGHAVTVSELYTVTSAQLKAIEGQLQPFDYVKAGEFWALAFVSTLSVYLVARCGGLILGLLRP